MNKEKWKKATLADVVALEQKSAVIQKERLIANQNKKKALISGVAETKSNLEQPPKIDLTDMSIKTKISLHHLEAWFYGNGRMSRVMLMEIDDYLESLEEEIETMEKSLNEKTK